MNSAAVPWERSGLKRRRRRVLLTFMLASVVGCGQSAAIPGDTEARAFLQGLVSAAQAGDMERLCKLADCIRDDMVNPPLVPTTAPTVVGTWVLVDSTTAAGQDTIGGRVLVLCGLDADSHPYRSEMLVFRANGELRTLDFRYWRNGTVGGGGTPNTPSAPPASADCG